MAPSQPQRYQVPDTPPGPRAVPEAPVRRSEADIALSGLPVEEYLCARIRRAEQALVAHHESVLRGYRLTLTQYGVLMTLSRRGGLSGAQLARATGVTQQTMAGVLAVLEKRALIERAESPAHAKVQISTLTDDGRRAAENAHDQIAGRERSLSQAFSYEEYRAICDLLERATEILLAQAG